MTKDAVSAIVKSVSLQIADNIPIHLLLDNTVNLICSYLKVDLCSVYTYDKESQKLTLVATQGFDKSFVGKIIIDPLKSLTGVVFDSQNVLNITYPDKHEKFTYIQGSYEEKYLSFLGVPISLGKECLGVLNLQKMEPEVFPNELVEMIQYLAQQLSVVMANTNLKKIFTSQKLVDNKELVKNNHVLSGETISKGISIGRAFVLQNQQFWHDLPIKKSNDSANEIALFKEALIQAKQETILIQERATEVFLEADAAIFFAQLLFLEDEYFLQEIEKYILDNKVTAASAVKIIVDKFIHKFKTQLTEQLAERAIDLQDIGIRLINFLHEDETETKELLQEDIILVASELMPSDFFKIPIERIVGIVCNYGGSTSHASILARSLNIPAMMGVTNILQSCKKSDYIVIDGFKKKVIVRPTDDIIANYTSLKEDNTELHEACIREKTFSNDKVRVLVQANVSISHDFKLLHQCQNDGVGLYRTEFMFMVHDCFPSEGEQLRIYRKIGKLADNEVTIRALDIGGDKVLPYFNLEDETDPMLGWRSIRILLERPEIFKPHLRALLRASNEYPIRILFPMIAHYEDAIMVKDFVEEVFYELQRDYSLKMPPLGAMIEMPSTVYQIDPILDIFDFVSIGTNDLVQYMFACDRGNNKVKNYFKPLHPVILNALNIVIKKANEKNKPVSLCGEMAGSKYAIPLLLGMGLRNLSMTVSAINRVKYLIGKLDISTCKKLFEEVRLLASEEQVYNKTKEFLKNEINKV